MSRPSASVYLVLSAAAAASTALAWISYKRSKPTKEVKKEEPPARDPPLTEIRSNPRVIQPNHVTIVHGSITGTTAKFAERLAKTLRVSQVYEMEAFDWWDELLNSETTEPATLVVLLPTYTNGTWPTKAEPLRDALEELTNDWRIAKFPLKRKLQVAVFGMGSSEYGEYGQPAKQAVTSFRKLGAKVIAFEVGDDAVGTRAQESFARFQTRLSSKLGTAILEDEDDESDDESDDEPEEDEPVQSSEPAVVDMEDMGDVMKQSAAKQQSEDPPEMVTPSQAKALKKEGYKLIGTHSAVKLCRWTKHQLRGRGGCYKHTFYGITSYQCMEATPSLACANKCVFCWRHHKNPVGKTWRWKTDDPKRIVQDAVDTHVKMIKETKGIPGVQMDRWKEAHTVRHCALSLVGEPIMYPHIDEFLGELHSRHISTFLVTNGQHPKAIESIRPITQLYVSVDAPTRDSLIEIDRPLFNDAWERLKESLQALKHKGQRTVARLTVVKGWNSDEISGYAELIALGCVSLVEVKGVTYCGKSDASNLNMTNTPWHHEVVELTSTLRDELRKLRADNPELPAYDLACEHKHSCSVLLARVDQFADDSSGERKWRTWIDYDKFQVLSQRHQDDPGFEFSVTDYTAETPSWALFGSNEEGFDPTDRRHRRSTKHPKYTQFDVDGIPTHDENDQPIAGSERTRLRKLMDIRKKQVGETSTVTELKGGAKEIQDASLMFRGLVVTKE